MKYCFVCIAPAPYCIYYYISVIYNWILELGASPYNGMLPLGRGGERMKKGLGNDCLTKLIQSHHINLKQNFDFSP